MMELSFRHDGGDRREDGNSLGNLEIGNVNEMLDLTEHWVAGVIPSTPSRHLNPPSSRKCREIDGYLTPGRDDLSDDNARHTPEIPAPPENPGVGASGLITPDDLTPPIMDRRTGPTRTSSKRFSVCGETVMVSPKSCYKPFEPGIPVVEEHEAIYQLLAKTSQQSQEYVEFTVDDFAIYFDNNAFPEEMRSLHQLNTKPRHSKFFLNGRLSVGNLAYFVKRVPIAALSVGGFEVGPVGGCGAAARRSVRDEIWVQSSLNCEREIYYRLRKPAREYRRFFQPFVWVADLARNFLSFLEAMEKRNRKVTISEFRLAFSTWLKKVHGTAPEFVRWKRQHPSEDFRTSIVANLGFLRKEAEGILGEERTYFHTLWNEIFHFDRYLPLGNGSDDNDKKNSRLPPTVVTRYIYDCFKHLPFGNRLEVVPLSLQTQGLRDELIKDHHLELPVRLHEQMKRLSNKAPRIQDIKPGDTISTPRDPVGSDSPWKRDQPRGFDDVDRWFALILACKSNRKGERVFDVLWYYRPVDTLCGIMTYPWNNELFLSDHCSCRERSKISEDEVMGKHEVEFGGTSTTNAEFFCRQTYIHEERKWITLKQEHLRCPHDGRAEEEAERGAEAEFQPGGTFLVVLSEDTSRSEPCEFVNVVRDDLGEFFRFRRLLRRRDVDPKAKDARPNELVYSQQFVRRKRQRIKGPCGVRFFKLSEHIPTPYDRDGVGGYFYITHQEVGLEAGAPKYIPLNQGEFPKKLKQAFDPRITIPKLRGLDLFCGGGNFGRGLEDGGAIEMRWANDYNIKAIHTYMANVAVPESVHPFVGSIDDLQRLAIQGQFSDNVPRVGEVDFISGGSPCPGFSNLTNDKTTDAQRKNQSLIASFASIIDVYRPKYGLLENVPGIVQREKYRDQDVFSQLVCTIVGLGYQTQIFLLDASSCGSPQRRTRIFLAFAAPGCRLPKRPEPTHSHPPNTNSLSVGSLPNGQTMAERPMPKYTPFKFVSAAEALGDLPCIHDAKPDICIPFPDHRVSIGITRSAQFQISCIPMWPLGMNFAQAWYGSDRKTPGSGTLSAADRLLFPPEKSTTISPTNRNSNAWGRQHPDRLIETIVTKPTLGDAKSGRSLHWGENRVMSIQEARRAQGFRDEDVLLGLPRDQYRVVGNSVAREPAVALGLAFRQAWVDTMAHKNKSGESVARIGIIERTEQEAIVVYDSDDEVPDSGGVDGDRREPGLSPEIIDEPSTRLSPATSPVLPSGTKRQRSDTVLDTAASNKAPRLNGHGTAGWASRSYHSIQDPLGREVIMIDDD